MEEKYNACKRRNEQQLLTIRKLELEIAKTKQLVNEKRQSNSTIKKKNEQYKNWIQQQKEYYIQKETKPKPKANISSTRDLSLLLATTPEKVCKRIEQLLRTRSLFQKPIETEQLENIRQLMDRLKDPYNPDTIDALFSDLIHSLPDLVEIDIDYSIDKDKEKYILEFQSYRKQKVNDLKATKEQLQLQVEESERALLLHVQSVHNNREVQSALIKMIRLKAANHQIQNELKSMRNHIEKLTSQIQFIKDQNIFNENDGSETIEIVAKMQYQAKSLLDTNTLFDITLQDSNSKSKDSKEIELLIDRINKAISKLKTEPTSIKNQPNNELLDAKNVVSPYTSISNIQLFKELVYLIQSINQLEEYSIANICKDIGKMLEKLIENWSSIINNKDISLLKSLPENYDGIDNVIQAFDAIKLHFEETKRQYMNKQDQTLKEKSELVNQIEQEIEKVKEAKNERNLITTIGKSFTLQDKPFCEWLQEVEQ